MGFLQHDLEAKGYVTKWAGTCTAISGYRTHQTAYLVERTNIEVAVCRHLIADVPGRVSSGGGCGEPGPGTW